ncbi:MAG: helix-turn-helix transcriptional regulator [Solirubrobacteraceae bacterium]
MASTNTIGEYLRARRELVRPEQAGLPDLGMRRRTPGLRREEVAMLAGVSADYYIRLEQGRDHHPSAQVLDALARALQLDDDATAYLHRLARPEPQRRRRAPTRPERVPAGILALLDTWTDTPAYVYGRYMDVLAANPLACALSPFNEPGTNLVRAVFLDPRFHDLHEDWDAAAKATVAGLRALVGPDGDDSHLNELVGRLSVSSEPFRHLWARHDVRPKRSGVTHREHPQVGPIDLTYEKLPIPDADRMTLCIYHAIPGSPSAQALSLLATIVHTELTATPMRPPPMPSTAPPTRSPSSQPT